MDKHHIDTAMLLLQSPFRAERSAPKHRGATFRSHLRFTKLPLETVGKLRLGPITGSYESAERGERVPFLGAWRPPKDARSDPHGDFPDSLARRSSLGSSLVVGWRVRARGMGTIPLTSLLRGPPPPSGPRCRPKGPPWRPAARGRLRRNAP